MDLQIKGKTAVVLGASRGLGLATARALAAEGVNLVLGARNLATLEENANAISTEFGVQVCCQSVDFKNPQSKERFLEMLFGIESLDILINNSGGPAPGKAPGIAGDVWQSDFQSMVLSLIQVMDTAANRMAAQGWGRIVTIASSGVKQPIPTLAVSNTLRSALVSYSKTLADQVAGQGVTLNVLLPGRIATERVAELDQAAAEKSGKEVQEVSAKSAAAIPAGRYGTAEEFAATAAFLCSGPAAYITGQVLAVDGGAMRSVY